MPPRVHYLNRDTVAVAVDNSSVARYRTRVFKLTTRREDGNPSLSENVHLSSAHGSQHSCFLWSQKRPAPNDQTLGKYVISPFSHMIASLESPVQPDKIAFRLDFFDRSNRIDSGWKTGAGHYLHRLTRRYGNGSHHARRNETGYLQRVTRKAFQGKGISIHLRVVDRRDIPWKVAILGAYPIESLEDRHAFRRQRRNIFEDNLSRRIY